MVNLSISSTPQFPKAHGVDTNPIIAFGPLLPGANTLSNPFSDGGPLCGPLAPTPTDAVNTAVSEWNNAFMSSDPSWSIDISAAEDIPSEEGPKSDKSGG